MSGSAPLYEPERLAGALERRGIEALVATRPANVLYLTRYRKGGRAAALVTAADPARPVLVVPASDIDFVLEDPQLDCEVRAFGSFFRSSAEGVELEPREARVAEIAAEARADLGSALELVAELLRRCGAAAGQVALDVPAGPADPSFAGNGATGEAGAALLRELRSVKTSEEQERLAEAAVIAERGISASVESISAGAFQPEIAAAYRTTVTCRQAAVRMDNVSIGRSSALGNVNQPGDVVAEGSVVRYDVGAIYAGYESDLSRCFSLGPAPERARRYHAALLEGQRAALELLGPGVTCGELHAEAVRTVRAAGIPHYERTNVGHGIGIHGDGYDAPLLAPESEVELEPGMVLCVETPYYELGFCGLQVEDMVVVRDDGYDPLSRLPGELRELP